MPKRSLCIALAAALLAVTSGAEAQIRPRTHSAAPAALNSLSGVTCSLAISVGYENGQAVVACFDQKTGQLYDIYVSEGDTPSPAEVIAYIQAYHMAYMVMATSSTSHVQAYNERIFLRLSNGKITGMELETSPGQ